MRYLLIINPLAGGGKAKNVITKIKVFFHLHGYEITVIETRRKGDAIKLTKRYRNKHDIVIACGGDGTINEVINGLAGTKKLLAIIPLGTENVLAQYLRIPLDIDAACLRILQGKVRKVDVGKTNGRYFILMTGIGFDAHVAAKVEPVLKKLIGSIAYPLTAIREIFAYEPAKITITANNKQYTGYYVIVSNCRYYGGKIPIAYRAQIDDGLLDVCIFRSPQIYNAIRYLVSTTILKEDLFRDVIYIKTKKLMVTAEKPTLVHTDCEIIGITPVNIGVKKKALTIIC
ncbi:diacylglycerol kinase family lipid kinase [Candidatus Woesearchaeota archaeon]|nr:diacylglycerol kinase family lipid kinase [Candidatus Woesearchaeota archaeon]